MTLWPSYQRCFCVRPVVIRYFCMLNQGLCSFPRPFYLEVCHVGFS